MAHSFRLVAVLALIATFALSGCGGGSSTHTGVGTITITGFSPGIIPGGVPTPFTITGFNFETVTGVTALVTFHALGGATPFADGTSDTASVTGEVQNDTTITGTTPPMRVCGVASISLEVTVTLESGVTSNTFGAGGGVIVVTAPTVTGTTPASVPALDPGSIVVNGTGFGPVGGTALVRFIADGGIQLFGAGTLADVELQGTITSDTQITVPEAPVASVCGAATRTASIQVTLNDGSCSLATVGALTYLRPEATTFATSGTGGGPGIARQTLTNAFTITGGVYAPVGSPCTVVFRTAGADAGLLAFANGTSDTAEVPGLIASATTITGVTPLSDTMPASFQATATVHFQNDACTQGVFLTYVAPPLITSVVNLRPPFDQANPSLLLADRFLPAVPTTLRADGANFVAGATVLVYDTAVGPSKPIGTGTLTARADTPPTRIEGTTSIDATLTAMTQATIRVTNPDGQSGEFTPFWFSVNDVLPNVNSSLDVRTNSEMSVSVNPLNPANAIVIVHNGGGPSNFSTIRAARTVDYGVNWTSVSVGPTQDGFAAGAFRFDPMGTFDRFGNFYVTYLVDDGRTLVAGQTATRALVLVQSAISPAAPGGVAGVTYAAAVQLMRETYVVGQTSPGLDRCTIAAGLEPVSGGEAVYVACTDFTNDVILLNGAACAGSGLALGAAFSGTTVPSPGTPIGPCIVSDGTHFVTHGAPSIGPSGEVHVTWINGDLAVAPNLVEIEHDIDFDGMAGSTFGFGTDVPACQSGMPGVRIYGFIVAQNNRGYPCIPMSVVLQGGGHGGRIVLNYTDVEPPIAPVASPSPQPNTRVVTRFSDDFGTSWSPAVPVHTDNLLHQFHCWMCQDPVRNDLYVTWYDTSFDPVAGRNRQVRRMTSVSHDGGSNWTSSLILSQGLSDCGIVAATEDNPTPANDFLEYNGVSAWDGCVYSAWGDNSNFTGDNPNGALVVDGTDSYVSVYMQH